MEIIDVTCAIIIREGSAMACLRAEGTEHARQWEFPGGKIEPGESAEECIIRELQEELNISVKVLRSLNAVVHQYARKTIRLIPFVCEITDGKPVANEHAKIQWQPLNMIDVLDWSEADRKLIELNREMLLY